MTKKVILALGCLALIVSLSSAAMADGITFTFAVGGATPPVTVNQAGLNAGPVDTVLVKDSKLNLSFPLGAAATVQVTSDHNTGYSAAGGFLVASYNGGAGNQITVLSPLCVGGADPGTCLLGTMNHGTYIAVNGDGGSWGGLYKITYVSPYITNLFSEPNIWNPNGGDSFVTTGNSFVDGGNTSSSQLGSGQVAFQTNNPIPEPGTLALMGTGILGLAGLLRRKKV